jgi:hypothetical protein
VERLNAPFGRRALIEEALEDPATDPNGTHVWAHAHRELDGPDRTPVWIKGSAVTSIREPSPVEPQGSGEVNAVLQVGSHHQSVHEDVLTARELINAHKGNV